VKDYDSGSGSNIAYTSLNVPIEVQMSYVHELRPNLKNVAILVDKENVSAMQTQAEPVAAFARQRGVNVIWAEVVNPKNARSELERVVPSAIADMKKTDPKLEHSLFWLTGSTSVFKEIDTINKLSGRVPVVSVVPEIVTEGASTAALGIGVSFDSNARLAAIYGERILAGQRPGDMKVGVVSPPDVSISFMKTREIGMRVPFNFFEIASSIYDYDGKVVRRVKTEILSN
jgi:putative ABC transport system substrate-binding protein